MDRHDGLGRLYLLLAALAFLLACSRLAPSRTTQPLAVEPAASNTGQIAVSSDDGTSTAWDWDDLLDYGDKLASVGSFIFAVVAVAFAYVDLRTQLREIKDQHKRIADEISRRPELVAGFGPDGRQRRRLLADSDSWSPSAGEVLMAAVLAVENRGKRSAHNLVVRLTVPRGTAIYDGTDPDPVASSGRPKQLTWIASVPLHPSQREDIKLWLLVRRRYATQDCELRVSMLYDDWAPQSETLLFGASEVHDTFDDPWPRNADFLAQ